MQIEIPDTKDLPFIKIEECSFVDAGNNNKTLSKTNIKISKGSGIYLIYSENLELLYIGQAKNLFNRISVHRFSMENAFFCKIILLNESKRYRTGVEQILIDKLNPIYMTNYDCYYI